MSLKPNVKKLSAQKPANMVNFFASIIIIGQPTMQRIITANGGQPNMKDIQDLLYVEYVQQSKVVTQLYDKTLLQPTAPLKDHIADLKNDPQALLLGNRSPINTKRLSP